MQLPPGLQEKDFERLMKKVATRVKWRTHFCAPYAHGKGVVIYLARYVKSGPFKNHQIQFDTDERITFRYTDHRDNRKKPCTLHHDELMRRILWHIPEKGHKRIRYYGLYHSHKKALRQQCRQQLGQYPEPETEVVLSWEQYLGTTGYQPTCKLSGLWRSPDTICSCSHTSPTSTTQAPKAEQSEPLMGNRQMMILPR